MLFPPYDDGDGEGHGEEDPLPELGLPDAVLELLVSSAAAPELRDPVERLHEGGQRDEAGHQGEPPEVALAVVLQGNDGRCSYDVRNGRGGVMLIRSGGRLHEFHIVVKFT